MANKGNMTLRIEPELKKQAAALFKSLGMDLSTNVLFDMSKQDIEIESKRTFRIAKVQEEKLQVKTVNVIEYNIINSDE